MSDQDRTANSNASSGNTTAADLVAQADTGARALPGGMGKLLLGLCFAWSLFQIYIGSEFPFFLQETIGTWLKEAAGLRIKFLFSNSEARLVHLSFALVLAAFAFPLFKGSPRNRIPWYDWLLAALGVVACLYKLVLQDSIAERAGLPTEGDLIISTIGMLVLAIAVFRALGLPLVIVASVFVIYVFFGDQSFIPDAIRWKGASYGKAMWHYWMQGEGVFGVALAVSTSLIFLFVLFGAILEKAGAGNYFIKLAFALLGHLRGGPAKAAVMASAMSGLYSGSSIANTVTTGTFTIPLMKRTGLPAEKAGAVEVASSTNGQLTPPVMGAAAFLISEFTGVPYVEIVKHAFLPAVVSYIALFYIVHLEALKLDLRGLPKHPSRLKLAAKLMNGAFSVIILAVLTGAIYFGFGWLKGALPDLTFPVAVLVFLAAYLFLLKVAARYPDLVVDDPDAPIEELPPAGATAITGLYYFLPIVVLIWCILIERFSPSFSAFWATMAMIFVTVTQHPIKAFFRGEGALARNLRQGWDEFVDGMIFGARNMIGIGVATGAAGIIVGTISLTGAHQVVGAFIEFLSGGNLMAMLILVALMSLILGMGLPTTANYIVVSSLMAPVIVALAAKSGLVLPLVAAHLFVFYFGILADDTPPVGLAAFAAAAISRGDPIKTGVQGFMYDIRTAILPFLFVFNTELLLIDVSPAKAVVVFVVAVIAMLAFASATQGYMFVRNRIWETLLLLLIAFTLFRPGFWLDQVSPPFSQVPASQVLAIAAEMPAGESLRVSVSGPDFDDPDVISVTNLVVPLPEGADALARFEAAGLIAIDEGERIVLEEPFPGTPFFDELGNSYDFYGDVQVEITHALVANERMVKEVFYIPAFVLLAGIILLQRRRLKIARLAAA